MEQGTLPYSPELEKLLLGTLMRYPELFNEDGDVLTPELFFGSRERSIFICIRELIQQGIPTTPVNLGEYAASRKSNLSRLEFAEMLTAADRPSYPHALRRLQSDMLRREAFVMLEKYVQRITNTYESIEAALNDLADEVKQKMSVSHAGSTVLSSSQSLDKLTNIVDENRAGRKPTGVLTGFAFIDNKGGLRPGTMSVIGAATSAGKTSLATTMAVNAAKFGTPVAYYSMEMQSEELWARIIGADAEIGSNVLMNYKLSDDEYRNFSVSVQRHRSLPVYIDDQATVTFERICRSIHQLTHAFNVRLVVIDYLQILTQTQHTDSVEESLSSIARTCKNIAMECQCAVLLLSQLARDRQNPHPKLSQLRGSGQIEESADNVFLIDRPESRNDLRPYAYEGEHAGVSTAGTAEIIIAKGRSIGISSHIVGFDAAHTKFFDVDPENYQKKDDRPF